jgi:hypothetical protein
MNFAATGNKMWIRYANQCKWPNLLCAGHLESSDLDLFQLDISGLGLSGYIASEIGLLENLVLYDSCKFGRNHAYLLIQHVVVARSVFIN